MYYEAKKASRDAIRFPEAPPTYADYEGWFYEEWTTNVSEFEAAHHIFSEATKADPTGDHGDEPQHPYPDDAVAALNDMNDMVLDGLKAYVPPFFCETDSAATAHVHRRKEGKGDDAGSFASSTQTSVEGKAEKTDGGEAGSKKDGAEGGVNFEDEEDGGEGAAAEGEGEDGESGEEDGDHHKEHEHEAEHDTAHMIQHNPFNKARFELLLHTVGALNGILSRVALHGDPTAEDSMFVNVQDLTFLKLGDAVLHLLKRDEAQPHYDKLVTTVIMCSNMVCNLVADHQRWHHRVVMAGGVPVLSKFVAFGNDELRQSATQALAILLSDVNMQAELPLDQAAAVVRSLLPLCRQNMEKLMNKPLGEPSQASHWCDRYHDGDDQAFNSSEKRTLKAMENAAVALWGATAAFRLNAADMSRDDREPTEEVPADGEGGGGDSEETRDLSKILIGCDGWFNIIWHMAQFYGVKVGQRRPAP